MEGHYGRLACAPHSTRGTFLRDYIGLEHLTAFADEARTQNEEAPAR